MFQFLQFHFEFRKAVFNIRRGCFEISEDKRLLGCLEFAECMFKFPGSVHAHFGIGKKNKDIGLLNEFIVFAL